MNLSIRAKMLASGVLALLLGLGIWLTPAAQASQRPAHAGPATSLVRGGSTVPLATTYPYKWSRIAWTGSDAVIAATDSHGDLYYFWQASGTTTWHKQLVAAGTSTRTYSKPSIASIGSAVVIAVLDNSGDLLYFYKESGSSTWAHEVLGTAAQNGGQFQAPSITTGDGQVLISVTNTIGALFTYSQPFNGTGWTESRAASGTFGPSSVTTVFDSLDSAYLGLLTASSGGTLYFWWEYLANPGWNQETIASPSVNGSYTGGSIAASANNVLVTAATTTGKVDSFVQPIGSSGWTQQAVATSGGPYTSPQIAWTGDVNGTSDSYDVITAASKTGALDFWWVQDGTSLAWTPETVAANGLQAVYATPGISVTKTSIVITAINTKPGNVMYWHQAFGTNPWTQQVVAKG